MAVFDTCSKDHRSDHWIVDVVTHQTSFGRRNNDPLFKRCCRACRCKGKSSGVDHVAGLEVHGVERIAIDDGDEVIGDARSVDGQIASWNGILPEQLTGLAVDRRDNAVARRAYDEGHRLAEGFDGGLLSDCRVGYDEFLCLCLGTF